MPTRRNPEAILRTAVAAGIAAWLVAGSAHAQDPATASTLGPSMPGVQMQQGEEQKLEQQLDREAAAQATAAKLTSAATTAAVPAVSAPTTPTPAPAIPVKAASAPANPTTTAAAPALPATTTAAGNSTAAAPRANEAATGASLRPSGPVTVTADHAEWQNGGDMVYSGNVSLNSDNLRLKGLRLELHQFPDGQYVARLGGSPARMDHQGDVDDKGRPEPPVSAQASTLTYDSRTGIIDIVGKAVLTRGKDEITGSAIHYNVAERRIQASSDSGGQVKIVIQPPPQKPAPVAATTPATAATTSTPKLATTPAAPVTTPAATPQPATAPPAANTAPPTASKPAATTATPAPPAPAAAPTDNNKNPDRKT